MKEKNSCRDHERRNVLKKIGMAGTGLAVGTGFVGTQSGDVRATHNCDWADDEVKTSTDTDEGGCKDLQLVQSAGVVWCDYWESNGHHYYLFDVYSGGAAEWESSDSEADAIKYQKLNVDVCGYDGNVSVKNSSNTGFWPANDDSVKEYFKDLAGDVASAINPYVGYSTWAIEEYEDLQDTFLSSDRNCPDNKYIVREVDRPNQNVESAVSMASHQFQILIDYKDGADDVYVDFDNIMKGSTSYWCNGYNEDYFVGTEVNINAHLWGAGNCNIY